MNDLLVGRIHHTRSRAVVNGSRVPDQIVDHKPVGLWYSIGPAWFDWCRAESFGSIERQRAYRLDIDTSDVLALTTDAAILDFARRFAADGPYRGVGIDWPAVAKQHKGIEIDPYSWALRFDDRVRWYCGWDVASGCLWDCSALRGAVEIEGFVEHAIETQDTRLR